MPWDVTIGPDLSSSQGPGSLRPICLGSGCAARVNSPRHSWDRLQGGDQLNCEPDAQERASLSGPGVKKPRPTPLGLMTQGESRDPAQSDLTIRIQDPACDPHVNYRQLPQLFGFLP